MGDRMIIRTIEEINIQCENVIEANKLRMNKIQDNLINLASVETMFIDLEKAILKKDFKKINNIISKKLFFEMVVIGLDNELIRAYERQINKKYFMDELRKSYIIRGVKGIQFAWMPIILRKG